MKLKIILLVYNLVFLQSRESDGKIPTLYNLPGYEMPVEFSDDEHRDLVVDDIKRFESLPPYQQKKYHELNHTDPNVGIEITRQILNRGKQKKFDFYELPDSIKNTEFYKKQAPIDFEGQYDNSTGKFHKQFKNKQMYEVMKSLHINDANKEIANFKRQQSFIQNEAQKFLKRPEYLKKDAGTSLLQMSENDKQATLVHLWEFLAPYNCWASSRWELAFLFSCAELATMEFVFMMPIPIMILIPMGQMCIIYWFMGYPCFSGIGNKGNPFAWLSEKLSNDAQNATVTFKTEFDTLRRVKFHSILFMTMPDQLSVEMTEDNNIWWTSVSEFKTIELGPFYFFWWLYYHEYPAYTYAKSVKIIMKGIRPNFHQNRYGIWLLMFFSQQHTVQIMEKTSDGWPRCLARAETGYFQTEKPFLLMNCLDAILQNDSREVFFLDSLFIKQWLDRMCLAGSPMTAGKPMNFITSQKCESSDHFKFILDRVGKFINKQDPQKCFGVKDDDNIKQVQTYGYVKTSGDLSDSRVNPYDVIDPNAQGWWAAPNYAKNATWELHFDRKYFIDEITIRFKYHPKTITVNILNEEMQWITYLHKTNCTSDDLILEICPMHVLALQIWFLEKDPEQNELNVPIFGLSKVICKRPGSPLSLQTCSYQGKSSKIVNRFKMEMIDYVDTTFLVPHKASRAYMISVYMTAKKQVEIFIVKIPYYHFIDRVAQYIKKCINIANLKVDQIYFRLHFYKNYKMPTKIVIGQSSSSGEANCYACSQITAASGCDIIKKRNSFRKNGFFWVKAKCMPAAQRVYCDFENAGGNFYLYQGHLAEKKKAIDANSPDKIIAICLKQGLEPVEIVSAKQFESLVEFVNQVGANSEDEYSIPFAYKWNFKLLTEKFQSLNSKSSKDCTSFAKKVMEEQTLMDKLTTIGSDLLVLKKSHNKLSKTFIAKEKIRGVICSENQDIKEKKDGQKEAKCTTNLGDLGSLKQGTIVKVQCPFDCGKRQIPLYGGPKFYHKASSICRAAVHAGGIADEEGGEVELKVVKGLEEYNGVIENNVESERKEGNIAEDAFTIVKKPLEKKCPNLKPKSFLSFDEITYKVKKQKSKDFSFLQLKVEDSFHNKLKKMPIGGKAADLNDKTDYEYAGNGDAYDQKKAKAYVDIQFAKRYNFYDEYLKFTKDSEKLLLVQFNILKGYEKTDVAPDFQEKQLATILLKYQASKIAFQDETYRFQAMIINMKKMVSDYYKDLAYLKRFEPHWEQYELPFDDVYESIDGKKAKGDPSSWKFTRDDVLPHRQAIQQQSPISCGQLFEQPKGDCTATMTILRYKKFFDFKMELDFKVRKMGFFGFIFRYKDEFNFYAIDLTENRVQLRRMMDGEQSILQTKEIDRILSDNWYNIQLTGVQSSIVFKLGPEMMAVNPQKYNYLPTTLQQQDAFYKKGLTGLFSDGTYGLYIDNFSVKHLTCQKDKVKEATIIEYQQPLSSRFREVYQADINQVWVQNSQESSRWVYQQNSFGRKKAIQKSLSTEAKSQFPMILQNKILRLGTMQFDMYLKQKTTELNFVFYYESDHNYYALVISKKKILIIQMANGKRQIVKKQERKDISTEKWYTLYFQITEYELDIFFEEALIENRVRLPLFDQIVERPQIRAYKLGFSVDRGTASIDNIILSPGKIPQPGKIAKPPSPPSPSPPAGNDESPGQSKNFLGEYWVTDGDTTDDSDDSDGGNKKKSDSSVDNALDKIFNPTFDYKLCLDTTISIQDKFCEKKSNGLAGPKSDCKQNFCPYCCSSQVSKKNIQEKCIQECQQTKPEKDKIYYQCFDSAKPEKSVQAICNILFTKKSDKPEQKKCKVDFCNLCCITIPLQYSKGLVKENMDDCYQSCSSKFDK